MIEEVYYESIAIDPDDMRRSWGQIIRLAGTGRRVLDIGCWIGKLAEQLAARGNTVVGVEINPDWARKAEAHCEAVHVGDVGDPAFRDALPGGFDVIILGDVIEHLHDPWTFLKSLHGKLAPGGFVICSVPNIANWKPRLGLLLGRFDYAPAGITAYQHLRFFTRATAEAMFRDAGFRPAGFGATTNRVPLFLARLFPTLFGIQFVYKLVPDGAA